MRAILTAAALTLVVATGTGCGSDSSPPQITTTVVVGAPAHSGLPKATTVAVDGVLLQTPEALATPAPDVEMLRAAAQSEQRSTLLVVSNYVPALGAYSGDLARAMLSDRAARTAVVADIVVAEQRFDGVQVQLSGLAGPDSAALVEFMEALHDSLPHDALVTLVVVASTDFGGYRERGYDIEALEPFVDRFVLQSFEPGGADLSPESLGDVGNIAEEADYLTSQVDPARVDLGITPSVGLSLVEATELAATSDLHGVVVASNSYPPK